MRFGRSCTHGRRGELCLERRTMFDLPGVPQEGVRTVSFAHGRVNLLAAACWDQHVRIYDVDKRNLQSTYTHGGAVLDAVFSPSNDFVYSGGADNQLRRYNVTADTALALGSHEKPVSAVRFDADSGLVFSGSWDASVKVWDPRQATSVCDLPQPAKVFAMDAKCGYVVVGTAGRSVQVYDARKLSSPMQRRESPLKYQTTCIGLFNDGTGFALGSVEGRVAIEFLSPDEQVQSKKYAFKCHRVKEEDTDTVFAVNSIAFHPVHGTFATGGSDGVVNVWDGANQKRICQFPKFDEEVSALSFNGAGNELAVAVSYTFDQGERDARHTAISIRTIEDADVRPKPRRRAA